MKDKSLSVFLVWIIVFVCLRNYNRHTSRELGGWWIPLIWPTRAFKPTANMPAFILPLTCCTCVSLYLLRSFCSWQHAGRWKLIYWQRFRFFHYAAHVLLEWAGWKWLFVACIFLKTHLSLLLPNSCLLAAFHCTIL